MLQQLDSAIAFVVIMLLLSLLVTAIVQAVSAVFDLRGKNLTRALADLFKQMDPSLRAASTDIPRFKRIRNWLIHPFSRTTLATQLADAVTTHPILAHTFTRAKAIRKDELLDVLKDLCSDDRADDINQTVRSALKNILASQVPGGTGTVDAARARALAAKLSGQFPNAKDDVETALLQIPANVSRLDAGVEKWFDSVMDRASDVLTRWTRTITIVISVLLVVLLHMDAGSILHQIAMSPEIKAGLNKISDRALAQASEITTDNDRGAVALKNFFAERKLAIPESISKAAPQLVTCTQAATWLGENSSKGTDIPKLTTEFRDFCEKQTAAALEKSEKQIRNLQADLARTELELIPSGVFGAKTDCIWKRFSTWGDHYLSSPRHMLGTLAMVILLSLGAPFWYNVLKELSNLKPKITQKVEREKSTS